MCPTPGERVHVVRGELWVTGTLIWCSDGRCGIQFEKEIVVGDWLAPAPNTGQARIDEIVASLKAGEVTPELTELDGRSRAKSQSFGLSSDLQIVCDLLLTLERDLSCSSLTIDRHGSKMPFLGQVVERMSNPDLLRRSKHQLADELGAAYQILVHLEDEFTDTRDTIARHGYKLQHLDLAMQMLSELTAELLFGSSGSENSRLENLRIACDKALQTPNTRPVN
jgi:hypothetical protein